LYGEPLNDKLADTEEETITETVLFATGFAGISDIEVSPYDGYMYEVSLGQGNIFRILPTEEGDTSVASAASPPAAPTETVPPILDNEDQVDTE
jgi:aldose sugar dehydrogenase